MESQRKTLNISDEDGSVLLLVSSLMENTGAHGIPNIKRAGTPLRRIMWAVLFLFGLSMFLVQGIQLLLDYTDFKVDVNFEIAYDHEVDFPAVTVCNMNPIKASYLQSNEELVKLFYDDYGDMPDVGNSSSPKKPNKYQDWDDLDYTSEESDYNNVLMARDIIANMSYSERRSSGHELRDMLLSCSFSGFPCALGNFSHFYNYRYGNCFTFIGRTNRSDQQLKTRKAGPLYGLSMEFYLEQNEYVSDIQTSAGLRVVVHPKNVMPFPEDNGISVSPGQETSIGLKRVKVTHLPNPYSNCHEEIRTNNVFLREFPDIVYNRDTCEKSCLYYQLIMQCNCSDPRYRYNASDGEICWSDQNDCVEDIEQKYIGSEIDHSCTCDSPCMEVSYEPTVSAAVWPNQKYRDEVIDIILQTDQLKEEYYDDETLIESNLLKILVFFNELNYEHIYDTEKYLWYSVLSDLGGQFGLWVGVSVLTLFEFIELIYDVLLIILYKCTDVSLKRNAETGEQQTTEISRKTPVFAFNHDGIT